MDKGNLRAIAQLKGVIAVWQDGDTVVVVADKTLSPQALDKLRKKLDRLEVIYLPPIKAL